MRESIKIEIIYLWEKYKDLLKYLGIVLLAPLWLLLIIIVFLFAPDDEADEQWCKEHNYQYPSFAGWNAHYIVKKWKKEYNRKERNRHKELIRLRLQAKRKEKPE